MSDFRQTFEQQEEWIKIVFSNAETFELFVKELQTIFEEVSCVDTVRRIYWKK